MSRSRAFCPRCGESVEPRTRKGTEATNPRTTNERAPVCETCFFAEFDLVDAPDRIEVSVCSGCGAIERGERWIDVGARDYTDVAIEEVSEALAIHVDAEAVSWGIDPEQVDENTIRMHCHVSAEVRGARREREFVVPVLISRGTCDRCGRIAGEDYAATVQVRARDRTPESDEREESVSIARSYVADREDAGDRNAFITEVGEREEGVDIRVSTTQIGAAIADRIVRRFGGAVDRSRTLVTEDGDGNEVYRMAYAVRLPSFRPGDVIDPAESEGHDPVVVESVRGNLKGVSLRTGEDYEASAEDGDAPDATVLGSIEDATTATLVAVVGEHAIQVLDPETYETRTIRRPADVDSATETIEVVRATGEVYALPADEPTKG